MIHRRFGSSLALPLLLVAVVLGWMQLNSRWSLEAWRSPGAGLGGDILEIAARVQVAAEQFPSPRNTFGSVDRLGAPLGADWSGYPVPDRLVFGVAGLLSHPFGVFGAINVLICTGYLLDALSFYLVGRALRWRPEWAATGALLFSFAVFHHAWAGTLSLSWTLALPPLLLLLRAIAGRARSAGVAARRRAQVAALAVGLWLGAGNPYFTYMAGQLLVGALALQWLRSRQFARLRLGTLALGGLVLAFGLTHWPLLVAPGGGTAATLVRDASGVDVYALRPLTLVTPPPVHRLDAFADLGQGLADASPYRTSEPIGGYLGLAGIAGLIFLIGQLVRWRPRRSSARLLEPSLLFIWIILFGSAGGLNSQLALLGLDQFRAGNRFAIFLVCAALLISTGRLQLWLRGRGAWSVPVALTVALVGWLDQTPSAPDASAQTLGRRIFADDRASAAEIARRAGPHFRVFQLPAVPFPEAAPIHGFGDYEHFRLFLAHRQLHLAYGGLRESPALRWYEWAARRPLVDLPTLLSDHGFGVLTVDRRAYLPEELATLLPALQSAGAQPFDLPRSSHLAAFQLNPRATPVAVTRDDPRFLPGWDSRVAANAIEPQAITGWFPPERDGDRTWRWAGAEARLGLWRPSDTSAASRAIRLSAQVTAIAPGEVSLLLGHHRIWRGPVQPGSYTRIEVIVPATTPHVEIIVQYSGKVLRPPSDGRQLGFQLAELSAVPATD